MLPLGTQLPSFELFDTVSGERKSSEQLQGSLAVVAFICNHCPFVVHIKDGLAKFARDYARPDVKIVAVSSNSVDSHPMDGPEQMAEDARRHGYVFPYLYDESQELALAFEARCTPEFYLFDRDGKLAYRGQFDDARPGKPTPISGSALRAALDALLEGKRPSDDQKPSVGCNIKWKPGRAPT
jgi:thiol-disulfide isomerase/thioredoxin